LGEQRVWGWSSVGAGGKNVGLWNISASAEYYNGGPLKRELMEHIGTTILNMLNGGHYGMGSDGNFASGEVWAKVCGPYFIYCNNVTNTLTGTNPPAQALYQDALAQGAAEQSAWPYAWFTNANYAPAANRGAVTGKLAINDSGNPNASAAGLWVGLIQQPSTTDSVFDFQQWMKPYQFWVQADANGNFTLTNVIAGANYTLYAYGPGAADTFLSQSQTGGAPPLIIDLPATPFAVTVAGGTTTNLGTVTWTPARVGATVFEIGYPDRKGDKFRHGDDYWVGDIGPTPTAPSPIWSKWLEYPFDFPSGPNYVVGQSRWTTDWNFIQPVTTDSQGNYNNSSSTITFTLASAPTNGATASLYLGLASDYYSAIIVTVNGNNLGNVSVTGTPNNSIPTTGYYPGYSDSDTNIREGNNAAFSDERLTFSASQLHAGVNTINIGIRQIGGSYFADHAMYDYVRLELTGYVPPPPVSVAAYPGNHGNLVCWPVTPGATSYNVLRSTTAGANYVSITNGVTGPGCGSGTNNAAYLDATAVNGTTYYYVVRSVNPTGFSTNSPSSSGVTPSSGIATTAPAAPSGLSVTSSGHQSVTLNWSASTNASFYSLWRSILANTGGGSSNTLNTIILNNTNTGTSYTDLSPTDGGIYQYFVTATGPGGTSTNSAAVVAVPLPAAPASLPASLTASFVQTNAITLNWSAVSGAVGYALYRATSSSGPYTYLQTVTETTYTDTGLNSATIYYYRVAAVNGGGVSANATDLVNSQQAFPPSLTAIGTNTQIILAWSAATNATSYTIKRGTSSGNETTTVATGYAGTSYTNSGLANGTTYYYVVMATGSGGGSGNSPEASATPFANASGIWTSAASGVWGAATNWSGGEIATGPGSLADFSTLRLPASLTVTLDSPRTVSALKFGDTSATYNWTLAGTNPLTLGASPEIQVVNQAATVATGIAGTNGITKTGPGLLTLGGASNTLTGGITINQGVLTLNFAAANAPAANLFPSINALTMGGGTLQLNGSSNTVSSQTFASTTLNAGSSVFSAAPASDTNYPTVNLAAVTANAGGLVEFLGPATVGAGGGNVASNATITTSAGGNSAFVGGSGAAFYASFFATVGLDDYAAATASAPYAVVGGSQISGFYTTASGTAGTGGNLDVTGNITGWSGQPYLTSMRFNTSLGANISVASYSTLTLADILVTPNVGAYNVTYNSGSFRPNASASGPFVVWQNNPAGELILNTGVGNAKNGSSAYVQSGPGTVSLTSTGNGYSLDSYLNGGVTLIAGNGSLGPPATAAAVNLNGGSVVANGTFAMDDAGVNARPFVLGSNGGGLAATAGNTMTVDGYIGGAGQLVIGVPASNANGNTPGQLPGTGPGTANPTPIMAAGTVVLNSAGNGFSGGTVLCSGTLIANNPAGSATGSGSVWVRSGGILAGIGTLAGPVTVSQGGMLLPGEPFGTLTLNSSLTLAAGSTTLLQIQHSPLTNAAVSLAGALTAGGALVVTNTGASALASGDSFPLFNAANYAGAFTSLVLPALATNLLWNTNTLMTSGTLSVVTLTAPTIAAIQFNGGSLTVSGSGGINRWPYVILAATNLATASWHPVATNQFDGSGNFTLTLTNAANPNQPQTFYKLQVR